MITYTRKGRDEGHVVIIIYSARVVCDSVCALRRESHSVTELLDFWFILTVFVSYSG